MRLFCVRAVIIANALLCGCAFYARHVEPARYTIKILYSNERLSGEALAGQSLLLLPILTRDGPDTTHFLSPVELSRLLSKVRGDLQFTYPGTFEKKIRSSETGRDTVSLKRFYDALYKGNITEVQTSESIWKAVDAAYLLAVRIKYAATIRGFDGNANRRLTMEVELWNTAASETVWRAEIVGFDKRPGANDVQFVVNALKEACGAFPGYVPGNNEKDW
jgi:hypothetical protein